MPDRKEPYKWQCPFCSAKGTARTKDAADMARALHIYLTH